MIEQDDDEFLSHDDAVSLAANVIEAAGEVDEAEVERVLTWARRVRQEQTFLDMAISGLLSVRARGDEIEVSAMVPDETETVH
jgi:hypothetical protein